MIENEAGIPGLPALLFDQGVFGVLIDIGVHVEGTVTIMKAIIQLCVMEVEKKGEIGAGQGRRGGDSLNLHRLTNQEDRRHLEDEALVTAMKKTMAGGEGEAADGHRKTIPTIVQYLPRLILEIVGDEGARDVDVHRDDGMEVAEVLPLLVRNHVVESR